MSEAPGAALGPETTLEAGATPGDGQDRRQLLAAALDALPEGAEEAAPGPVEAAPAAAAAKPGEAAPAAAAAPVEAAAATSAPASWKQEHHELFAKADPALQAYITQRETEMRQGIEPLIPKAKFADEVNGVIGRYQANIQAAGVPAVAAIDTLMQADNILRNAPLEQKIAYVKQLLPQYGIDLSGIDWAANAVDPRMATLERELHNLRNTITPVVQQQADSQNQALLSEIEAFSADKPHFKAVQPHMSQLLLGGKATSLQDAYDQAMEPWAPILSDAEAGRQAAAKAAERKAADDAAKAARAAAVQVRSSTPGRAATPPKAQDRRSMLAEQLDGVGERV